MVEKLKYFRGKTINAWCKGVSHDGNWFAYVNYISDEICPSVYASKFITQYYKKVANPKLKLIAVNWNLSI